MIEVPAKDVANRFGFYTDEALLRPVGIQKHGVTRVVMISFKEYARLTRERQVIRTEDLDDETLHAIMTAEISPRAEELNYLMDDADCVVLRNMVDDD